MAITAKTVAVASAAQQLEERCTRFSLLYTGSPARVQERELETVLESLRLLLAEIGENVLYAPLGSFMVDENGLRTDVPGKAMGLQHITYRPITRTFGCYLTSTPMRRADGTMVVYSPLPQMDESGNDITRIVTLSDIIEMGYSLREIVDFLLRLATVVSFDFYSKAAANHAPGIA